MIKNIYRLLIALITLLIILVVYLSVIGINTEKFNSNIISQVKKIEPDLELKLSKVSAKLNPFNFEIDIKTIGADLVYRNKIIKIQTIKSNVSLISFLKSEFAITGISISTNSLEIKDLMIFMRLLNNDTKFFIAEQFIKKGYLVADLELEFDEQGNIKNNYKIKGLVKDGQIGLFKSYNLDKIDFIFEIKDKNLKFNNVSLLFNNKKISIPELVSLKKNNEYLISGKLNNQSIELDKKEIEGLIKKKLLGLNIQKIKFSSQNKFGFKIDKNFKLNDLNIISEIQLDNLKLKNSFNLKNFFPKIKNEIFFNNQKIKLKYEKDILSIIGKGEALLQNEIDKIKYEILRKKNEFHLNTTLNISKNPFELHLLNYQKNKNSLLELNLKVKQIKKNELIFDEINLKEKKNIISIKDLILSKNYKINSIGNIDLDYLDKDNLKNKIDLTKKNKSYFISGNSFNVDKIIDKLLNSEDDNKSDFVNKNLKLTFDIKRVYLDKKNILNNLRGFLFFDKNEVSELSLESKFSNQKNIKFTIKNNGEEKITTLFSYKAKPFVDRYKFIKGFEEGILDYYSIKKNNITNSTLKIDNFKIQEIPVLAKLLTLASLQGIADLLTGEGIRFTDFEMKFSNKGKLMTIEELYAIGPAISILMDGYIERNKLISLRGTLVPATTVNRTISSIPIIGDILVGKKVGEGVFGVSFKIKGPPKDLETTVNPIKTLTPRFITRTLEKIKKN
tara:strand:- start:751 stop:2943 length:2193 start_codon:yes stop_codon:yes gene_type:complete